MSTRSLRAARLTRSSACSTVVASGFSTSTCFPASSARLTSAWWVAGGVAIPTPAPPGAASPASARAQRVGGGRRRRDHARVDRRVREHGVELGLDRDAGELVCEGGPANLVGLAQRLQRHLRN